MKRFPGRRYLVIATRRKDGREVLSPMWFVESDPGILMRTPDNSGKLKRIRNFPEVRVAPCTMTGRVTGDWIPGIARIAPERTDEAGAAIAGKYGLWKRLIDLVNRLRQARVVAIEIRFGD